MTTNDTALASRYSAALDEIEQLREQLADVRAKFQDALWTASQHAGDAKEALAELEKVRAQLTAANHHADGLTADLRTTQQANTAYANENAELKALAENLLQHIDTIRAHWATLLPRDVGETLLARAAHLSGAIKAEVAR